MATYKYKPGPHSAGAYQISGRPFLSGGTIGGGAEATISFPGVTKSITFINTGSNPMRIHFDTSVGTAVVSQKNFIDIPAPAAGNNLNRLKLDVRCAKVYISSASGTNYQIAAEITTIPATDMHLTGSGIN